MIIKRIAGATHNYGGNGYLNLPVRVSYLDDNTPVCQSAWEITPTEVEQLKNGGSLILTILGGQSPVSLSVEAAAEEVME